MASSNYKRLLTRILLALLTGVSQVQSYSRGAPKGVCDTMVPVHNQALPQTIQSPFEVRLNTTQVKPGGVVQVQLAPQQRNDAFKGFMVIAKEESRSDSQPQGRFTIPKNSSGSVQHVNCDDVPGTSVTHTDNSPKNSIVFNWVAPREPGEYRIYGTFVKTKHVFWVNVPSDPVSVRETRQVGPPVAPSYTNIYSGCGQNSSTSKGCFGLPEKCVAAGNCDMLVTFRKASNSENTLQIQLMGLLTNDTHNNGYIAVGFSKDDLMGSDSVMGCFQSDDGTVHIHEYYNNGRKNVEVDQNTIQSQGRQGALIDGTISCEFTIADTIDFSRRNRGPRFELLTEPLQLLLASGVTDTGKHGTLQYHDNNRGASKTKAQLVNYPAWDRHDDKDDQSTVGGNGDHSTVDEIYNGCSADNCFGIPGNCIDSRNCEVVGKFRPINGTSGRGVQGIDIELSGTTSEEGPEGSYIAIGISENDKMGTDSVFGCYVNGSVVKVGEYYNIPRTSGTKSWAVSRANGDAVISSKSGKLQDGTIGCSFTIKPVINLEAQLQRTYDLSSENVFLLLAKGPSANDDKLGYHSTKAPSPEPFQLAQGKQRPRGTCLGIPAGCCQTQKCDVMTNFVAKNEGGRATYEFYLEGKVQKQLSSYVAVGISDDNRMGSDSVFACYNNNGSTVTVREFYNDPSYANYPVVRLPEENIFVSAAGVLNETHMSCRFTIESKINLNDSIQKIFDLSEHPYHILIAEGPMKESGMLSHHVARLVSGEKILIPEKSELSTSRYQEDGPSCAGTPAGCCRSGSCVIKSNFAAKRVGGSIIGYDIQLEGTLQPNQNYIAFGLSQDTSMGSDSVIGCYLDGDSVRVGEFYNEIRSKGYSNKRMNRKSDDEVILSSTAELTDGRMSCSFTIKPEIDLMSEINDKFDLSKSIYILLAGGPMESPQSALGYHGALKFVTGERMIMSEKRDSNSSKSTIKIELHGVLMIIAWVLLASFGKFTARYYKKEFVGIEICGKALWFVIHQICMFSTVVITVIAIILIFVEIDGYTPAVATAEKYHPILGLIVFVLSILQVFIAFFRCDPGSDHRIIFNWVHWTIGTACHWFGIACIFFSADLKKANLQNHGTYWSTIIAFVIFHCILHVSMSFHTFFMDNKNIITRALQPGPLKSNAQEKDSCEGSRYSELILLAELVGATVSSAILVYCVCESV
ncbi:unnamed protein product [Allacma fusca]|uniref:Ferric-chelate reductase 1 n=1 Tax=Allacma fusca TaxID=39272 RepID=A0A8J2PUH7_9HEXA|nr:unnamed protein product [Allacma fusca]